MKRCITLLLVVCLVFALPGCSGRAGEAPDTAPGSTALSGTTSSDTLTVAELCLTDLPFTVVRPEDSRNAVISAGQRVRNYIGETSGKYPDLKSDWVRPGTDPDSINSCEILIGNTNRTQSGSVQCTDGWYVGVQQDKVVILASREKYYDTAVDYFISQCRVGEDGKIYIMRNSEHSEKVEDIYAGVELTLRVGSYNIKHGADVGLDMSVIAADITALGLDVVGIQEVDQMTSRVGGLDTMKALSEASGYEYYAFARAIDFRGGQYGTGVLSRYPIDSFDVIPLSSGSAEARSAGHAVINVDGVRLDFFNTHLSYEEKSLRTAQIQQLAPILDACEAYIITGDFNTSDTGEFSLWDGAGFVNRNTYPTFPSSGKGIDNIFFSPDWSVCTAGMGPEGHSDHRMLWAELKFERK